MKRFWTEVSLEERGGGWAVLLDRKPLHTPRRAVLILPNLALAEAVGEEWRAVAAELDPRQMPLTGLANAAVDHVARDASSFAASPASYAETDLFCYRAASPPGLVARQAALWDPFLGWARRRYDIDFEIVEGVIHRPQPPQTVARLTHAVESLEPFALAGLAPLVTIGGSLVAALAFHESWADEERLWGATQVDERWQAEQWGEDAEAAAIRAARHRDLSAAARFLRLLRSPPPPERSPRRPSGTSAR